jgi:hypothetical protein
VCNYNGKVISVPKHHAIKMYMRVKVKSNAFLVPANGAVSLKLRPLYCRRKNPRYVSVGAGYGPDVKAECKILPLPCRIQVIHHIARHCSKRATLENSSWYVNCQKINTFKDVTFEISTSRVRTTLKNLKTFFTRKQKEQAKICNFCIKSHMTG